MKKSGGKAVDGVSFVARPGVITGLLGPNGAGKTTILKAICALHYPTEGAVRVMGRDVESFPVEVRSLVGYVSEQPALIGSLTTKEFLHYAGELRFAGRAGAVVADAVERVVEECQLQEVFHKPISHLSKGYRQRLSFAQALLHNPPVLVLDEPVSGLDPAQIRQMRDMIKRLGSKKTILLSTHLMQEVEALCQQVHIISRGRLVASGSAQEIAAATGTKSFEDAFLKLTR
ncbi:MAG: ABC transporter ATP-binding protein [Treponema sp.]|nr:ABC transporter ATP-binding protein [Treponema sp.]